MKIWAYGDSFTAGDQDLPDHGDSDLNVLKRNRYEVSWAAQLAKILDCELTNRAVPGTSNFPQIDMLVSDLPNINTNDLIFFGITSPLRERFWLAERAKKFFIRLRRKEQVSLGGQWLVETNKIHDIDHLNYTDFLFTVAMLEKLEQLHNIKIIKFNAFIDMQCNVKNFIGHNTPGNSLLHLITGNWGKKNVNLTKAHVNSNNNYKDYGHLVTSKLHPNFKGHTKIAEWMHGNISNIK
jgi:hypothetical protein